MTRPNSEAPKPVLVLATIQNSSLFNERATTLTDQQSELLDKVESELLRNFDAKRTTVSYQGLDVLERRFGTFWGSSLWAQLLANIQQTRHRAFVDDQVGQSWTTREKISNYGRSIAALIYKSAKPKFRKSLDRLKVIETLLSDKHIYLWTYLVEQGAQGALILEDDFAPHEDFTSGDISEVISNSVGSFDYVNLSRSFTFQKLGLPPQEEDYILDFIKTSTESQGYAPSMREIGEAAGLNSPASTCRQSAWLRPWYAANTSGVGSIPTERIVTSNAAASDA